MKFISIGPNDLNNYDTLISEKPAFLKIYSPGCGHCVAMKDDWNALKNAKEIANLDINIIEMDADAISNKVKSKSGQINGGVPTIRYVHKNGKKWVDYKNERSTKEMVDFVLEQTNNKNTQMSGGKKTKKSIRKGMRKSIKKTKKSIRKYIKKTKKSRKTIKKY